jgi:hypothetical protein
VDQESFCKIVLRLIREGDVKHIINVCYSFALLDLIMIRKCRHEMTANYVWTWLLHPGMLVIDLACRKKMVAIEFDAPSHFLREVGSGKAL